MLAHRTPGGAEAWIDVISVITIAAVAAGYGRGVHEIWARLGPGAVVSGLSVAAFGAGLALLYLSGQGPLHHLAEGSLAGHMTQHMVLLLAGLLLAAGRAGLPLALAVPHRARRWLGRARARVLRGWLRRPLHLALVAAAVHTAALWFWHLPQPFLAAALSPPVHLVEHATLVGASWLLWSTVVKAGRGSRHAAVAFFVLFTAGMAASAQGAVLTFAPAPVYPPAAFGAAVADELRDQQLAGLVMWVPMDVVALGLAGTIFLRWLRQADQRSPAERDRQPVTDSKGLPR